MTIWRVTCVWSCLYAAAVGLAPQGVMLPSVPSAASPAASVVSPVQTGNVGIAAPVASVASDAQFATSAGGQPFITPAQASWTDRESQMMESLQNTQRIGAYDTLHRFRGAQMEQQQVSQTSYALASSTIKSACWIGSLVIAALAGGLAGAAAMEKARAGKYNRSAIEMSASNGMLQSVTQHLKFAIASFGSTARFSPGNRVMGTVTGYNPHGSIRGQDPSVGVAFERRSIGSARGAACASALSRGRGPTMTLGTEALRPSIAGSCSEVSHVPPRCAPWDPSRRALSASSHSADIWQGQLAPGHGGVAGDASGLLGFAAPALSMATRTAVQVSGSRVRLRRGAVIARPALPTSGQALFVEGARGGLDLDEVQRRWEDIDQSGKKVGDIAAMCALLGCVQRELGYMAALHEGTVGSGRILRTVPPLPLVVTWHARDRTDEIYASSLAFDEGETLLNQLLDCAKQSSRDARFGVVPGTESKGVQAKVSLLRDFEDITSEPESWTLGTHGLWYRHPLEDGGHVVRVYVPEIVEKVAGDKSDGFAARRVLQALTAQDSDETYESVDDLEPTIEDDDAVDDDELDDEGAETLQSMAELGELPPGGLLLRFKTIIGSYAVSNLPSMRTREVLRENEQKALVAQAVSMQDDGSQVGIRFAALSAPSTGGGVAAVATKQDGAERVRAFIVPTTGVYTNAHLAFREGLQNRSELGRVRRIFALASVWDCFIDGCGLPERRCAWYGKVPLDLPVLERLRSSRGFSELSVEQDMRERGMEVLLPIVQSCLSEDQDFTFVPVLVGAVTEKNVQQYCEVLTPYLSDPASLFLVAGNIDTELGLGLPAAAAVDPASPSWLQEVSGMLSLRDEPAKTYQALDLFMSMLKKNDQLAEEQVTVDRCF